MSSVRADARSCEFCAHLFIVVGFLQHSECQFFVIDSGFDVFPRIKFEVYPEIVNKYVNVVSKPLVKQVRIFSALYVSLIFDYS